MVPVTAETFGDRIDRAHRSGDGYVGCCPAHDDQRESLSWADGERGLVVTCHAGCSVNAITQALGLRVADLFRDAARPSRNGHAPRGRIVATYDYADERGELLYQVVRFEPKDFRHRRPDGRGGWTWNLNGARRVLYRLSELAEARTVHVVEGERDADALAALGLAATTNAGGAGKWSDDYTGTLVALGIEMVVILPDHDDAGDRHARDVARSCLAAGLAVKVLRLPGLPPKGDVSDYLAAGHSREELEALVSESRPVTAADVADAGAGPWSRARTAAELLAEPASDGEWIDYPLCLRGAITEINAPRGTGKSIVILARMVALARTGLRVLYLDRDNAPATLRKRLAGLGAHDVTTFRVLPRALAPRLEDVEAWAAFPIRDYDVVVLDSWDTFAEGAGEQDSRRTTLAQAALLDIARRDGAPAVVIAGNVTKDGARGRGSGVREDRADLVYEARDITGFVPTGRKPWWEEMPPADRNTWAERATRRTSRAKSGMIRLALISTKSRDEEDPAPVAFEVDFTAAPWSVRNVTAELVAAGDHAKAAALAQEQQALDQGADALVAEITRRATAGVAAIRKKAAESYLCELGLPRAKARALLRDRTGTAWRMAPVDGRAVAVVPLGPLLSGEMAAESEGAENPHKQRGCEGENAAGRMNTGRPNRPNHDTPHSLGNTRIGKMRPDSSVTVDLWGVPAADPTEEAAL